MNSTHHLFFVTPREGVEEGVYVSADDHHEARVIGGKYLRTPCTKLGSLLQQRGVSIAIGVVDSTEADMLLSSRS